MLSVAAIGALHDELVLDPKPGLVTPRDRGSHDDMDATTFVRSLFALRRYFADIADAGRRHAPFAELQALGIAAEARMLRATGGVNTHRGAIFSLGLLCAAAAAPPPPPLGEGRGGPTQARCRSSAPTPTLPQRRRE